MTKKQLIDINTELFLMRQKRNIEGPYREFVEKRLTGLVYVFIFGLILFLILTLVKLFK